MQIWRANDRPGRPGPATYFTGTVWMEPVIEAPEPARITGLRVTFAPGAWTHWHTHPLGQTLHVAEGVGRVQCEGGPVVAILPGDTVWIPPGVVHWHGAAPDHTMTHIALQEREDGTQVTWLHAVADDEYAVEPGEAPADP